jgi:molecular chaperone DnaK
MAVVGFDFGTTNSLVSVISAGRAINFLDEENLPYPSVVCYEGTRSIVGREAKDRLSEAGLGVHGNVIRSPKGLLDRESVHIEGVERSPVDIVAQVVEYVSNQALGGRRRKDLPTLDGAVVTIPVNMDGKRRAALRNAFLKAGVRIVQFVHEPLAALYGYLRSEGEYEAMLRQYDRKLMLVFDWGGGTLDLTLCRLIDGMLVQIRNDGTDEVGGDVFDDLIKNDIVRGVMSKRGLSDETDIYPDGMTRLVHRCEQGKINLSTRASVEIYVGSFFRGISSEELDYSLSRDELERMTKGLLDKGLSRIQSLLDMAGVSPAQISLCLATGGMANMPAIKSRLHEWFGAKRVHVSDRAATLIAEGAAWVAHDKAKLHLAKNVELLLARNSHMPLIKAGTVMPQEGEVKKSQFHLFCADPTDGFAKFQLQVPVRPGASILANDRREPLENLVVAVDSKARPLRERLELDVEIDHNLILRAYARSLNKKDLAEAEVHNLEFGLSLPGAVANPSNQGEWDNSGDSEGPKNKGALVMRSNIAHIASDILVPGEVLYQFDSSYFDSRRYPPEIQEHERLYYVPCSICKRSANDPLCKCASQSTVFQDKGGTSPDGMTR